MKPAHLALAVLLLAVPAAARAETLIRGVPHVRQEPDFCGEACAEMYLRKLGKSFTQDDVFAWCGIDPALGRGARTPELRRGLSRIGFLTGDVWYRVKKSRAEVERHWKALEKDLGAGVPSIVCMRYDERPDTTEHFRLVLGYDDSSDEVIYHEPAADRGAYLRMSRKRFLDLWPLDYQLDRWLLVRIRLEPGKLAESPPKRAGRYTVAQYARHVRELKRRLPGDGFTVVYQHPFVVVGDEDDDVVRRRAANTVRWAARHLKASYFAEDPLEILDVWLFKDEVSYRKHAKLLFGAEPGTPFGYYSASDRALVMNIATGGGTLVHEIVHPFVEANFPDCPSWFNEGLGSLYEQCRERGGIIVGLTNWRLKGLKKAIRGGGLPSFETLCGMGSGTFYGSDRGDNYAQARYLLYYLQEKGLLRHYYREFLAARKDDPSGYRTLVKVLREEDMKAFQKRWEAWVLRLRYP